MENISTHAPLTRCDDYTDGLLTITLISTHAPLTRCDQIVFRVIRPCSDFYSRTSYEVRRPAG